MDEALGVYLTGKFSRPAGSWKAVWRTVPDVLLEDSDYGDLEFVGVLVEVKDFFPPKLIQPIFFVGESQLPCMHLSFVV